MYSEAYSKSFSIFAAHSAYNIFVLYEESLFTGLFCFWSRIFALIVPFPDSELTFTFSGPVSQSVETSASGSGGCRFDCCGSVCYMFWNRLFCAV